MSDIDDAYESYEKDYQHRKNEVCSRLLTIRNNCPDDTFSKWLLEINDFFFEHFYEHENSPYHIVNHHKYEGIDELLDTKFKKKFGYEGSNFDLCYEFDNGGEE